MPIDITEYNFDTTVPSQEGWIVQDSDGTYVETTDVYIDTEKTYYLHEVTNTIDAFVDLNYDKIQNLIEEFGEIKSDENVIWTAATPSGTTYSFNGEEWLTESTTLPADIYYNKAGFDYEVASKETHMVDEISVTPTGLSQIYDEANDIWVNREFSDPTSIYTNKTIEHPDTHEISIHLPSIGNTISNVWDLVYGEGDKDNGYKRKTNIKWD